MLADGSRLIATCTRGLEEVLRDELVALGHPDARAGRGLAEFRGGPRQLAKANLWLRTAMRVLVPLASGPASGREELYDLARSVEWESLIAPGQTFAVTVAGRTTGFGNTSFAALTAKDAIVDRLRERRGFRPDVDRHEPDVGIHLHLSGASAGLSLDSSGEPLSRRGWRPHAAPAPLAESLAAGILLLAGYDGSRALLDPMCGSGTLAIEAALIATRTAPGRLRRYSFERWAGIDRRIVERERAAAEAGRRTAPAPIIGRDAEPRAVSAARRNAAMAGVTDAIMIERGDVTSLAAPAPGSLIVMNPPYGERLGEADRLGDLYAAIGDALKRGGADSTAWILSGNPELAKRIGLRPSRRIVLFNGPIECRLLRFDLYQGSRRR